MLSRVEAQSPPTKLCIFGDSHLSAASRALKEAPVLGDLAYEFWGADGPSFRDLTLVDGRITPGKIAKDVVATVNGQGRETLGPTDFDAFLFYGARLRMSEFMPPMLDLLARPFAHVSAAVARKQVRSFLGKTRSYRFAQHFAAQNPKASVVFTPTSLLTADILPRVANGYRYAKKAQEPHRAILRDLLDEAGREDGITFLHQPERTIVKGMFTDPAYGIAGAQEDKDAVHKAPAYARLILETYAKQVCLPVTQV
ncbi:hypothetical protein AQS8620_00418 [Aquimixticola soesokkakensis]|uniref:SGNH hydrolase-type esterase domain-containing protein n=1 Tax=Aquimixticola soesokkakensis TaxID=1519096 RepID=A0A1Y5RL09_9RHOB|nr:hypothetical protein [Aquimixticola soesokkakensis]SLN18973.1 hypothetical protein AQS8620_00418 [Aquimixticola soesokkakensis]